MICLESHGEIQVYLRRENVSNKLIEIYFVAIKWAPILRK